MSIVLINGAYEVGFLNDLLQMRKWRFRAVNKSIELINASGPCLSNSRIQSLALWCLCENHQVKQQQGEAGRGKGGQKWRCAWRASYSHQARENSGKVRRKCYVWVSGFFLSEEGATQRSDWGRGRAGRVQRRQGGRLSWWWKEPTMSLTQNFRKKHQWYEQLRGHSLITSKSVGSGCGNWWKKEEIIDELLKHICSPYC